MMEIQKLTPVLVVEAIEPLLPFWTEQLGYTKTIDVPHGDRLGFAILEKGPSEVMLQTQASIEADAPAVAKRVRPGATVLFMEVKSLEAAKRAAKGLEVLVPERVTDYGMKEIFVRCPDGQVIGFAEKV